MNRRILVTMAMLVGTTAALWLWQGQRAGQPQVTVQAAAQRTAQAAATPAPQQSATALPGLAGSYAVRYVTTMEGLSASAGTRQKMALTLTGTLDVAGLAAQGNDENVAFRLRNPALTGDDGMLQAANLTRETAAPALGKAFVAQVDGEGRLGQARFEADVPPGVQALLLNLMQHAQLVRPAGAQGPTWQVTEQDLNHSYTAEYTLAGAQVHKHWQEHGGDELQTLPAGYQATHDVTFALADARVAQVKAHSEGKAELGGGAQTALVFATDLQWDRQADVDAAWAKGLHPETLVAFERERGVKPLRRPDPREVDAILTSADAAATAKDWQKRHQLAAELATAMARNDAATDLAAKQLRESTSEPVRRTVLEAMAQAESPAAQKALVGAAADPKLDAETRRQALVAGAFVQRPQPEYLAQLGALAYSPTDHEFGAMAAMTMAQMVRVAQAQDADGGKLTEGGPAQKLAQTFTAQATARLTPQAPPAASAGATTSPAVLLHDGKTRWNWVAALGNAALPGTLPLLLTLLKDQGEFTRSAAAYSLRFFDPAQVVTALTETMAQDDSIYVRAAVLRACAFLGPAATKTLVHKALRYDKSEMVRETAGYVVAAWMQKTPDLKDLLDDAIAHESSVKVVDTLKNFAQPGRVAAPFHLVSGTPETPSGSTQTKEAP